MKTALSIRAKRTLRRNARRPGVVSLNLVPMIDVFMVLVFFLLVTTQSVDNLRSPRELALPSSLSVSLPTDAPIIMITKQAVLIQGLQVMTLDEAIAAPADKPLPPLRAELLKVTLMQVAGATPGATTRGEVNIMADREIPYAVLKKVLATCGDLKFARIAVSVAHGSRRGGQ
ncbi:MAG: biopolymer transporter ExbD [Stagnimonas sp.]|nr:biopolymer transporter ExbD [Stagnimonas sp.]